jgi:hypothetical protein
MVCLGLLVFFSCSRPTPAVDRLAFCEAYRPIYMAHGDTRKTKEQIAVDNRIWTSACGAARR